MLELMLPRLDVPAEDRQQQQQQQQQSLLLGRVRVPPKTLM